MDNETNVNLNEASIFYKKTEDTPEVILDKEKALIELSGMSLPDDVKTFYEPILEWLEGYNNDPPAKGTQVNFKFHYLNSSSSKAIMEILSRIKKLYQKGHGLKINWYYLEEDEDMLETGEDFADIMELPVNLIPIEEE